MRKKRVNLCLFVVNFGWRLRNRGVVVNGRRKKKKTALFPKERVEIEANAEREVVRRGKLK